MTHVLNYPLERARTQFGAHMAKLTHSGVTLPTSVDLRKGDSPIYDQGQLGSCTANAVGALCEFDQRAEGDPAWTPSRLFIYYQERLDQGTIPQDSGATIAESIQACVKYGFPPETDWPYNISVYTQKPSAVAYADALVNKITAYAAVSRDLNSIKSVLAAGRPVIFGFPVYQQYESVGPDGNVAMPAGSLLGGHANMFEGYDDNHRNIDGTLGAFIDRNSWNTSWGMGGYCWFPYNYAVKYASDFWTASTVSPVPAPTPPSPPPNPPSPVGLKIWHVTDGDGHAHVLNEVLGA